MNNDDLLLKYNQDYLDIVNSDVYKIGYSLVYIIKNIKNGHFYKAFREISNKFISIKIRRLSQKRYVESTLFPKNNTTRIAVYTAIFGKYDELKEPRYVDDRCDYYVVTDDVVKKNSVWKVVNISQIISKEKSSRYLNRFFKMHPFELFADYDYVVYVDGNFEICGPIGNLIDYINPKTDIAVHNMFNRDCIYDEAKACKLLKKGNYRRIEKQIKKYRLGGFPEHFGMYECPIVVSKHSQISTKLFNQWWEEYKESGERDQICLPYVIWKNNHDFLDVGIIGNDVRKNCYFRKKKHNDNS